MVEIVDSLTINNVVKELKELTKLILQHKNNKLEINLSKVKEVDSGGIALLLELKERARSYNCDLLIYNPTWCILKESNEIEVKQI